MASTKRRHASAAKRKTFINSPGNLIRRIRQWSRQGACKAALDEWDHLEEVTKHETSPKLLKARTDALHAIGACMRRSRKS